MRGFQNATCCLPTTTTSQDIEDWVNLEGRDIVQWTDALGEERTIAEKEEEGALFGFLRTGYNLYANSSPSPLYVHSKRRRVQQGETKLSGLD